MTETELRKLEGSIDPDTLRLAAEVRRLRGLLVAAYEQVLDTPGTEELVFKDLEEAERWLLVGAPWASATIVVEARIVRLDYVGETTVDEFAMTVTAIFRSTSCRPGFRFLSDRRNVEPPTTEYVERGVTFMHAHREQVVGGRWAVVLKDFVSNRCSIGPTCLVESMPYGPSAGHTHPGDGRVMLVGWITAKTLHLAPTKPRPGCTGTNVVKHATSEVALLSQAFDEVIDKGVDPIFAADAIGFFMRHILGALSQSNATKLSVRMVLEGVVAANAALWSSRDAARLLIALQKELDADGGIATPYIQKVIAMVREGNTRSEILTKDGMLSVPRSPPF